MYPIRGVIHLYFSIRAIKALQTSANPVFIIIRIGNWYGKLIPELFYGLHFHIVVQSVLGCSMHPSFLSAWHVRLNFVYKCIDMKNPYRLPSSQNQFSRWHVSWSSRWFRSHLIHRFYTTTIHILLDWFEYSIVSCCPSSWVWSKPVWCARWGRSTESKESGLHFNRFFLHFFQSLKSPFSRYDLAFSK